MINGKRAITPETAIIFGEALGTSPELWMNLESQYQLSKVRSQQSSVSRKAQLHTKFPVREMIKRGWIESTKNIDILEKQLFDFFGIKHIDDTPTFHCAAKKQSYAETSIQQIAWLCRARKVALSAPAQKYSSANLSAAIEELKAELEYVDGIRNVASILAKAGIRLVIIEPLTGSKIDGACFWLDSKSPVIALSLRYDRVDNFWHTLIPRTATSLLSSLPWNQCPVCSGMAVQFAVECVSSLLRNSQCRAEMACDNAGSSRMGNQNS